MSDVLPTIVYLLCFLTSTGCAILLARAYRRSQARRFLAQMEPMMIAKADRRSR